MPSMRSVPGVTYRSPIRGYGVRSTFAFSTAWKRPTVCLPSNSGGDKSVKCRKWERTEGLRSNASTLETKPER